MNFHNFSPFKSLSINDVKDQNLKKDLTDVRDYGLTHKDNNGNPQQINRYKVFVYEKQTITFPTNATTISNSNASSEDISILNSIAVALYKFDNITVNVTGYADAVNANNQSISNARALGTKNYITDWIKTNVSNITDDELTKISNRISTNGSGVAPNSRGDNVNDRKVDVNVNGDLNKTASDYAKNPK